MHRYLNGKRVAGIGYPRKIGKQRTIQIKAGGGDEEDDSRERIGEKRGKTAKSGELVAKFVKASSVPCDFPERNRDTTPLYISISIRIKPIVQFPS